ncbi:hypothetical protein [Dyadobacter fanqingshengii]|uniref:Abi family protein n=1 Tax=Dyadobacter fanqingshengii TaxID=2906443 RepID=A0A9X1TGI6_9BACT|nr:hypothetical protein [Dyadobacter fanqingshengii]MCF0040477.1 hypothetical protein [Dyadobacter fanqingshengii]USJ37781.1 hypothetical protein NFI81_08345 [Dyadobacter fanqingshengii]
MKINLRDKYLSKPRYDRYLLAGRNDHERAGNLYHANIALSKAFHPLISQFEVVLRNSIDSILRELFMDRNWIINEKLGFMSDESLRKSNFYLRKCVEAVENKSRKARLPITNAKIVSDQTFGFWTAIFEPAHYRLLQGQPIKVFKHKPSIENRASIYGRLEMIRNFRNRVNHCEPLCFHANHIDCSHALAMRINLYKMIEWIDPELFPFFAGIDNVEESIDQLLDV